MSEVGRGFPRQNERATRLPRGKVLGGGEQLGRLDRQVSGLRLVSLLSRWRLLLCLFCWPLVSCCPGGAGVPWGSVLAAFSSHSSCPLLRSSSTPEASLTICSLMRPTHVPARPGPLNSTCISTHVPSIFPPVLCLGERHRHPPSYLSQRIL